MPDIETRKNFNSGLREGTKPKTYKQASGVLVSAASLERMEKLARDLGGAGSAKALRLAATKAEGVSDGR
jgi:hypothetical protein